MPDSQILDQIVASLWAHEDVRAIWLGGSLARGDADPYSDIDLRVAVQPPRLAHWMRPDVANRLGARALAHRSFSLGPAGYLHHVLLHTGDILDLCVYSTDQEPAPEALQILACRDAECGERLKCVVAPMVEPDGPAEASAIRQLLEDFWTNTHKHRKVLARDLDLMAFAGLDAERRIYLRLCYIAATGRDCGERQPQTIFGLTQIVRGIRGACGDRALAATGAPARTRDEICRAIETLRAEVAAVGRELADRYGFAYPQELEDVVRNAWEGYRSGVR